MRRSLLVLATMTLFFTPRGVSAQGDGRFEATPQAGFLRISELDETAVGVGAQAGWRPTPLVAVDGAFGWFPAIDAIAGAFGTQQRVLGLVGIRAGGAAGRVEVFGKVRPGVMRFVGKDSVVCIALAIFPPPLGCSLLAGHTAFAVDVGGGAAIPITSSGRAYLRAEAGDFVLRYGLVARRHGEITDGFVSHNLMIGVGFGWRF